METALPDRRTPPPPRGIPIRPQRPCPVTTARLFFGRRNPLAPNTLGLAAARGAESVVRFYLAGTDNRAAGNLRLGDELPGVPPFAPPLRPAWLPSHADRLCCPALLFDIRNAPAPIPPPRSKATAPKPPPARTEGEIQTNPDTVPSPAIPQTTHSKTTSCRNRPPPIHREYSPVIQTSKVSLARTLSMGVPACPLRQPQLDCRGRKAPLGLSTLHRPTGRPRNRSVQPPKGLHGAAADPVQTPVMQRTLRFTAISKRRIPLRWRGATTGSCC